MMVLECGANQQVRLFPTVFWSEIALPTMAVEHFLERSTTAQ
jgi:hypothetical protein